MIQDLWYKNAIIYSVSVGSFVDSDGRGHGDFKGLMRRLDYLQGLGINTVWLMPFQPSPRKDHGYDVSDYYKACGRGIEYIMRTKASSPFGERRC